MAFPDLFRTRPRTRPAHAPVSSCGWSTWSSAWGVAGASQDDGAAGPAPEQPAPPAEFAPPLGCAPLPAPATTAAAACDAYFAAGWREDPPAARAVPLPHEEGSAVFAAPVGLPG